MNNKQITEILQLFWKQALAVIDSKYMSVSKTRSVIKTEANKVVPNLIDDRLPEVVGAELDNYALKSTLANEIQKINDNLTSTLTKHNLDIKDVKDMITNLDLGVKYVITDTIDGIEIKPGVIYLVPKASADGETNVYTEYLSYNKADGSIAIEKIGDTTVSFEGYATEDYVNNKYTMISNSLGTAAGCNAACFQPAGSYQSAITTSNKIGVSCITGLGTLACCTCSLGTAASYHCSSFAPASIANCPGLNCTGTITSVASCTVSKAATLTCNYICFGTNCIWIG